LEDVDCVISSLRKKEVAPAPVPPKAATTRSKASGVKRKKSSEWEEECELLEKSTSEVHCNPAI
jgi:hypothetical protein